MDDPKIRDDKVEKKTLKLKIKLPDAKQKKPEWVPIIQMMYISVKSTLTQRQNRYS